MTSRLKCNLSKGWVSAFAVIPLLCGLVAGDESQPNGQNPGLSGRLVPKESLILQATEIDLEKHHVRITWKNNGVSKIRIGLPDRRLKFPNGPWKFPKHSFHGGFATVDLSGSVEFEDETVDLVELLWGVGPLPVFSEKVRGVNIAPGAELSMVFDLERLFDNPRTRDLDSVKVKFSYSVYGNMTGSYWQGNWGGVVNSKAISILR